MGTSWQGVLRASRPRLHIRGTMGYVVEGRRGNGGKGDGRERRGDVVEGGENRNSVLLFELDLVGANLATVSVERSLRGKR